MDYGIWESLVHLAGNRLSGHKKVWLMGGYGLSQVWVKTEMTVPPPARYSNYYCKVFQDPDHRFMLLVLRGD
ncbi:hypothetical protein L208DRAFT_1552968 [Tricholoma matsutake]|nr:hypothetical protein L208DRAFT_1552968 [Tricholoma matsutake 945]